MTDVTLMGPVRRTVHRGDDDLATAGLGLARLAGSPVRFADSAHPTPAEVRRRAIQSGWKGLVDCGPLGGFGRVYGTVPNAPGREYSAFSRLPQAHHPHRVLCQIPDGFDPRARCLMVAPASGSRGIYGAAALGGWALAHGCAVVYTDKGAGTGYFDCAEGTGVALDGTRAEAGGVMLEFEPETWSAAAGIAVKHAHSGDHPEADWGRHVLDAARFGLAMLGEAFPEGAPFTPGNTRIMAAGISNGGAAVLQAAGADGDGILAGVVAVEPNVQTPGRGRALYDYATEAALWMPAALTAPRFAQVPFARVGMNEIPAWLARRQSLRARGWLPDDTSASGEAALAHLQQSGWQDEAIATAALSVTFDLWRSVGATYASAYLRAGVGAMPGGFSFRGIAVDGLGAAAVRAAWWATGNGIPPDVGIGLFGGMDVSSDPTLPGVLALRALWEGDAQAATALHAAVDALSAGLPRKELPIWVLHGAEDGLIPAAFTSDPYVEWLRGQGRSARYWRVPHAQHFDAFLQLPDFGDRYVPLLPYVHAALDRMYAHVVAGAPLPDLPTPEPRSRGAAALDRDMLDLPG